ncbi:MAG: GMC family oxidoreductase N-terminal domain-containing protein, partial [bacterium]
MRLGGAEKTLTARSEVLLSAGELQSPALMQLSGVGPGAALQALGLPVVHDLPGVGRHLHDHIDVVQVVNAPGLAPTFGLSLGGLARAAGGLLGWRGARTG